MSDDRKALFDSVVSQAVKRFAAQWKKTGGEMTPWPKPGEKEKQDG